MFPLLTVKVEVGTLRAVENDRREDQQSSNPPSEAPHREEESRDWEGGSAARRDEDSGGYREPRERGEAYPESSQESSYERPPQDSQHNDPQQPYESSQPTEGGGEPMPPGQGGQTGGGGGGRGRRRGGRGRMSPRDRRMQARRGGRDRDRGGPYQRPPGAGGGHAGPEDREREERYSDLPPEQRSLILQAKAEVERVREALEHVLRDLENVSEMLVRAEHEKDVAEAEIEQLRDQLRRLHR